MNKYIRHIISVIICSSCLTAHTQEPDPSLCQLRITTDPDGAIVSVDGSRGSPAPLVISDVLPGDHLLTAQKNGYNIARRTINLLAGQRIAVSMELEPVTGLVLVHSNPAGAEVQIDGADQGKTPILLTGLSIAKHRAQLVLAGYLPKTLDINVENRIPFKIEETLTSDSANLTLKSTPAGAKVVINGVSKGVTPCVADRIPGGDSTIELSYDGFKPYKKTLRLVAGQQEDITAVLEPIPAEITIVSIPGKARIYIENQFKGEAPVTLQNLNPGSYRIRAELTGYETIARNIELKRAEQRTEELRLDGNCGQIEITTEPAGMQILIDGQPRGTTSFKESDTDRVSQPLTIDLVPEGPHEVQLTNKGYFPLKFSTKVERGKTITLHRQMQRRFIPDYEVRTISDVYQGVLVQVEPDGSIKLELRPGVFSTIPIKTIRSHQPLRTEPLPVSN